jgi:hypothetical protein
VFRLRAITIAMAGLLAAAPLDAQAELTVEDFHVRNAADLVDLCTATSDNEVGVQAIHFCHGFVSGAWQYSRAMAAGPGGHPVVCPPDPAPTRAQSIAGFVEWSKQNPTAMQEPAVDALFRYFAGKYPCPATAKGETK